MKSVRTFTALDLVRLPRLDANTAQSLGSAVLAAAESVTLSEGPKEALAEVSIAVNALIEAASTHKLPAPIANDGPSSRDADSKLDSAWVGTYDWLTGWARLPEEPKAQVAAALRDRLFPDGLKFTRYSFTKEWAESNTRLSLINDSELEKSFETLGGSAFLETIRKTHKVYGDILGITKAQEEEAARATRIRDAMDRLVDALRGYVLQVSAMARKSDPASQTLVDKLLAPIANWQSPPVGKGSASAPVANEPPVTTEPGCLPAPTSGGFKSG